MVTRFTFASKILYLVLMYMFQNMHWRCSEKLRIRWPVEVARHGNVIVSVKAKMLDAKDSRKGFVAMFSWESSRKTPKMKARSGVVF